MLERPRRQARLAVLATYGWYRAADALAELGATVHLAHPLGVKAFSYRRVKNDQRDTADLADLLRMGRLPHGEPGAVTMALRDTLPGSSAARSPTPTGG